MPNPEPAENMLRAEADAGHSFYSSLRASILEHLFVGELLRTLWRQGARKMELLRAEVDSGGYDLVIECNGAVRHIQLKSSYRGATTDEVTVNTAIMAKPSGCVIWIMFDERTMKLGPFLWFGGGPGEPIPSLGERRGRQTRRNIERGRNERPETRVLKKRSFSSVQRLDQLVRKLFGNSADRRRRLPADL